MLWGFLPGNSFQDLIRLISIHQATLNCVDGILRSRRRNPRILKGVAVDEARNHRHWISITFLLFHVHCLLLSLPLAAALLFHWPGFFWDSRVIGLTYWDGISPWGILDRPACGKVALFGGFSQILWRFFMMVPGHPSNPLWDSCEILWAFNFPIPNLGSAST